MKLLALAAALCPTGCALADPCSNTIIRDVGFGTSRAVLFSRDCGATTSLSTQLSVMTGSGSPNGSGNAFVADGGSGELPTGVPWAEVSWLRDGRLFVRFDASARIFKQERSVNEVTILYRPERRHMP